MNQPMSLDRLVADWMADAAPLDTADQLTERILTATARTRPMPPWLALLRESPMTTQAQVLVGSPTRRLALVALLLVMLGAAVLAGALLLRPPALPGDDWTGFRGGPSHDGTGLSGPIGSPVVNWSFQAGGAIKNNLAVSAGIVIVPSEDGVLHGIALADGSERWAFRPGTSLTGPAVGGGLAYVADGAGIVHAIDVTSGVERWRTDGPIAGASAANLGGGGVYIGTGDGRIVALDAATGRSRWTTAIAGPRDALGSPAYADGVVYGASSAGGVVALDATTGRELRRFDVGGDPVGTIVALDGLVFAGSPADTDEGSLRAFDAATGELRWAVDEALASPSIAGGLAVSGSSIGVITARDVTTGLERWRFAAAGTNRPPVIAGGTLFVAADTERRIYALDLATGDQLWVLAFDAENQCCLALSGGLILAGSMDGVVRAIGGDGSPLVARPTVAPTMAPTPPPTVAPPPLADPFTVLRRISAAELGVDRPLGIAVAGNGEIYVSDRSDRITRMDRAGTVIGVIGGPGDGPGQFDFSPASISENPHGSLAIGPDGSLYVSDSDNHRVQVLTPDGTFVRAFGSQGTARGQFQLAFDLTVDQAGNVYIVDDGAMNLQKFGPDGSVIWVVSFDGSVDPALLGHGHTPSIDAQGRIVVSIDDNGKVVRISPDGAFLDAFDAFACGATLDPAGNVYADDCVGRSVRVFSSDGTLIGANDDLGTNSPVFGPDGLVVALGADGSLVYLEVDLPTTP